VRDYIHVMDLARAHVKALQWSASRPAGTCEAFNIGTGRGHSVLEVMRAFISSTGVELPYVMGPRRPGDVPQVYADATRANTILGWHHTQDLPTALRDAWRWQQALAKAAV